MEPTVKSWLLPVTFVVGAALGVGGTLLAVQPKTTHEHAEQAQGDELPAVVATVGGEDIQKAELEAMTAPVEAQLEAQKYEVRTQAVDQLVAQKLFEKEAKAKGVTLQELFDKEVVGSVPPPTDEQIQAFYDEHAAEIGGAPLEQVKPQIASHLGQQAAEQRIRDYLAELKAKTPVEINVETPRVEVATDGQPRRGPEDARVTIVEFSDFQCPYCAEAAGELKKVSDKYGDDVAIVFRNYPLDIHRDAQMAAEAGECAFDQGKFWEMHDAMFAAPADLGRDKLIADAQSAGLDVNAFTTCLDEHQKAAEVEADVQAGEKIGVQGTPAVIVNGRMLSGGATADAISQMVDQELAKKPSS